MNVYLFILFSCFWTNFTMASSYDTYTAEKMDVQALENLSERLKPFGAIPLDAHNGGSIPIFGVNQIFTNHQFTQMIVVKFNVSGDLKKDQWEALDQGMVHHFEQNQKTIAVFTKGFSFQQNHQILHHIKSVHFAQTRFKINLFDTAMADDSCAQNAGSAFSFSHLEKIDSHLLFQSLLSCVSGAKQGSYDATIGAVSDLASMAWSGLKFLGNEAKDLYTRPGQKLNQYYSGVVKGTLALKDILMFVVDLHLHPEQALANIKAKFGPVGEKIAAVFKNLIGLPPQVMIEMSCSIITGIGIDALISVITAGAMSGKLALTLNRLAHQLKKLTKVFHIMHKLPLEKLTQWNFGKLNQTKFIKALISGKIPEFKIDLLEKLGDSELDELAVGVLQCSI